MVEERKNPDTIALINISSTFHMELKAKWEYNQALKTNQNISTGSRNIWKIIALAKYRTHVTGNAGNQ